jgi:excisionase family DNA binding protein
MNAEVSPTTRALGRKNHVAAMLNVSTRTVDNLMRSGRIPYIKIGGAVRFDLSQIEKALAKQTIGAN